MFAIFHRVKSISDVYVLLTDNHKVLKAVICAGLYPNVAKLDTTSFKKWRWIFILYVSSSWKIYIWNMLTWPIYSTIITRIFLLRPAKLCTKHEKKIAIHPSSVNADEKEFESRWMLYHLKMKTAKVCPYHSYAPLHMCILLVSIAHLVYFWAHKVI